jgi:hypothetical protein
VALTALGDEKRTAGWRSVAAWISVILLLVAMGLSKSSVGLIFLCLAGYLDLRRNWRRPVRMIGLGAVLLAIGAGTLYLVAPRGTAGVVQGSIAENFSIDDSPLRPLVVYGSAIFALLLSLIAAGGLRPLWRELRRGGGLHFELMIGCIAAATVPPLALVMVDGGAHYFTAVQTWWCFAAVLALLPAANVRFAGFVLGRLPQSRILTGLAGATLYLLPIVFLVANLDSLLKDRGNQALSASLLVRTHDMAYYTDDKRRVVRADVRRGSALFTQGSFWHPAEAPTPAGPLVDALRQLHQRYGIALAAYVAPDDHAFWNLRASCPGKPILLFALTSVPLIDGLPPLWSECLFNSRAIYGLETIPPRQSDAPLDDAALCQRAKSHGFGFVYRIEDLAALDRNRLLSCPQD